MENNDLSQSSSRELNRKAYTKPMVEKVQLVLDEAVLGTGCKNFGITGLSGTDCGISIAPCNQAGS